MRMHFAWLIALAVTLTTLPARAADPAGFKTLAIGDPAPDFKLPGVDGQDYSLASFAKSKLLLVVFTCNHCPTAQAYEDRIIQLHNDYAGRGVALVAISPNDAQAVRLDELGYTDLGDSFEDMKQRAKDRDFKFPYLYDGETQAASLAYGVLATPQVYLFDQDRKLRYVGRIDDSDVKTVTSHDTKNALDALLAGQPVPVEKTRVFGCSTKWSDKREDARKSLEKWNAEEVTLSPIDEAGIRKLAKNETDKLLVVNVWATWCGPCVAELPELTTMHRMYRKRNFQMVTISIDGIEDRQSALKTLREHHLSGTNYISIVDTKDKLADLLDKDWPGPVPYTLLIAPGGKVLYRKTGELNPLEVKRAIVAHLGRTYASRVTK
jgi:peroxiredoxin